MKLMTKELAMHSQIRRFYIEEPTLHIHQVNGTGKAQRVFGCGTKLVSEFVRNGTTWPAGYVIAGIFCLKAENEWLDYDFIVGTRFGNGYDNLYDPEIGYEYPFTAENLYDEKHPFAFSENSYSVGEAHSRVREGQTTEFLGSVLSDHTTYDKTKTFLPFTSQVGSIANTVYEYRMAYNESMYSSPVCVKQLRYYDEPEAVERFLYFLPSSIQVKKQSIVYSGVTTDAEPSNFIHSISVEENVSNVQIGWWGNSYHDAISLSMFIPDLESLDVAGRYYVAEDTETIAKRVFVAVPIPGSPPVVHKDLCAGYCDSLGKFYPGGGTRHFVFNGALPKSLYFVSETLKKMGYNDSEIHHISTFEPVEINQTLKVYPYSVNENKTLEFTHMTLQPARYEITQAEVETTLTTSGGDVSQTLTGSAIDEGIIRIYFEIPSNALEYKINKITIEADYYDPTTGESAVVEKDFEINDDIPNPAGKKLYIYIERFGYASVGGDYAPLWGANYAPTNI